MSMINKDSKQVAWTTAVLSASILAYGITKIEAASAALHKKRMPDKTIQASPNRPPTKSLIHK